MSIRRGTRRSVIVEMGRWRFRLTIGRFVWAWDRQEYGFNKGYPAGAIACPLFLVTYLKRKYSPVRIA